MPHIVIVAEKVTDLIIKRVVTLFVPSLGLICPHNNVIICTVEVCQTVILFVGGTVILWLRNVSPRSHNPNSTLHAIRYVKKEDVGVDRLRCRYTAHTPAVRAWNKIVLCAPQRCVQESI